MITEVLLVLPLYLILFFIWWRLRYVIKIMASVGDVLNNDEFFGDVVDTSKEGIEQHRKREELRSVIDNDKAHLIGNKWKHERVDHASDETMNEMFTAYRRCELNEIGEKTGKAVGKHVINLYSTGISQMVKIRDVYKLRQDNENNPIIKDQMASLDCLLVCTFGIFLAPILVAVHTVSNLDLVNELENEGYESN